MSTSLWSPSTGRILRQAAENRSKTIKIGTKSRHFNKPFPSPVDWREHWIYFLMVDRFNHPSAAVAHPPWDEGYCGFQGGVLAGITEKLDYLAELGAGALWLTPVLKNCSHEEGSYHGYGIQDFLQVDPRFGTEQEFQRLVDEAHARGLYVILDIVLNHSGNVFSYEGIGSQADWADWPRTINWRDEQGQFRTDWQEAPAQCAPDAAVWPVELRRNDFFRRRGKADGLRGDFSVLKELVTEYEASNAEVGFHYPVRNALIRAYQYAIAKYDIDGYRIDTLKYVEDAFARVFGNAMREYALSIGKHNFFTFGEVWDDEAKIRAFIGRDTQSEDETVGVDAALDFPLFYKLPAVAKGSEAPARLKELFENRKTVYKKHLSSHGEASRYFVTFLDNHDLDERYYYENPAEPDAYRHQLTLGVGLLFCLQGIPCLYYGTEQGLHGRGNCREWAREALWGKPDAFNTAHPFYQAIQAISAVRARCPALRFGRQYFRQVSGDGWHFGISANPNGIVAVSRILNDTEVIVAANTNTAGDWQGQVLVDYSLNLAGRNWDLLYSNQRAATPGITTAVQSASYGVSVDGHSAGGAVRSIQIRLAPMELQILKHADIG